jgi:hypothetical protein
MLSLSEESTRTDVIGCPNALVLTAGNVVDVRRCRAPRTGGPHAYLLFVKATTPTVDYPCVAARTDRRHIVEGHGGAGTISRRQITSACRCPNVTTLSNLPISQAYGKSRMSMPTLSNTFS